MEQSDGHQSRSERQQGKLKKCGSEWHGGRCVGEYLWPRQMPYNTVVLVSSGRSETNQYPTVAHEARSNDQADASGELERTSFRDVATAGNQ